MTTIREGSSSHGSQADKSGDLSQINFNLSHTHTHTPTHTHTHRYEGTNFPALDLKHENVLIISKSDI